MDRGDYSLSPFPLLPTPTHNTYPLQETFEGMASSSVPVQHRGALWKVILASQRESVDYRNALVGLISIEAERNLLYTLTDDTVVEGMLDILDLESQAETSKLEGGQKKAFILLKKMCKTYGRFPSSLVIMNGIELEGSYACAGGGASDVWKARYGGRFVAVKSMRIFLPQGDGKGSHIDRAMQKLKQKFCREAAVWRGLCHPNLVPFLGVNETLFPLSLISEWMVNGTIAQFVTKNPETNRLKLLHDVASGLEYLHDWSFVHSDIKSANILINSKLNACIGDFGLTDLISTASISMGLTPPTGGTPRYMAPELLTAGQVSTKQSDIYSFGMVAYQVYAHSLPFSHLSDLQVIIEITKGGRPVRPLHREPLGLDDSVWGMMQACWDTDPQARPTTKGVRSFLEPISRSWVPPTLETIHSLDLESPEIVTDSSTQNWMSDAPEVHGISSTIKRMYDSVVGSYRALGSPRHDILRPLEDQAHTEYARILQDRIRSCAEAGTVVLW